MDIILTKDAQKLVAAAYKEYLMKRKNGIDKIKAKYFVDMNLKETYFPDYTNNDYYETVSEMSRALGCKQYLNGAFCLSDQAIVYMENRFKEGLTDTVSFLAQLIP